MKIVLIGAGKVGKKIAEQLVAERLDVIIVDINAARLNTLASNQDVMCIQGNGALYEVQVEAGVADADIVIAATPKDEVNMLCCLLAKKLGAGRCIARVRNPEYYSQLGYISDELGLSFAVNPEYLAASEIKRLIMLPEAAQIEAFANERIELIIFKISDGSPIIGKSLSETFKKSKILVCTAERDGEIIIPDGSFVPQCGDKISVTCTHIEAKKFFKKSGFAHGKIHSVMIVGGGRLGFYLASQLSELGFEVKIIENNYDRCRELSDLLSDVSIINADGTDHNILKEEGIETVDAFAALTGIDEENMIMSMYAQSKNVSKIVTKVTRGSYVTMSDTLGLDSTVSPKALAANNILGYIRAMKNSEKSNNVETIYKILDDKVEALEFIVRDDAPYINKPLSTLKTRKDVIIASIVRGDMSIIPNGDDCIKLGDSIIVVSASKALNNLSEIFI